MTAIALALGLQVLYRLLRSRRVTLLRPTLAQMLAALVENAVEKLVRGPTSTTACDGGGSGNVWWWWWCFWM